MSAGETRIAMLSVHACPVGNLGAKDTGGMSVYVRELARELGEQGLVVDIYTRVHDPEDQQVVTLGRNARLIHLTAGEKKGIPKLAVYPYLADFAGNIDNFRKGNGIKYDLIFSHYWLSGCAGKYLHRWWHVPHITMFHTLGAVKNAVGLDEDEPELRIDTERHLTRDCHRIIVATELEKANLVSYYGASPESISVIPCGVDLNLFQLMDRKVAKQQLGLDDHQIILFVGRIDRIKGLDRLLEAMTYLQDRQGLRLLIIGGDEHSQPELAGLQRLSRDLGIDDSVAFLGVVKHVELPRYYNAADVCVVPSYSESFGLVALESLACGTSVVTTNVGAAKSVIRQGETGYVVMDDSPSSLAEKITSILSGSSSNMKSAVSIRTSVTQYSWSNTARAVAEEFRQVIAWYTKGTP